MTAFKLLREIETPEFCYLSEVLQWLAFARVPEAYWQDEKLDYRFFEEMFDLDDPPIPNTPPGHTDTETSFAELPLDPEFAAAFSDRETMNLEHYDKFIQSHEAKQPKDKYLQTLREQRKEAEKYHLEKAEWNAEYEEYIDPFKSEIYLALRNGLIEGFGRKMPSTDWEKSIEILDAKDNLGRRNQARKD